MLTTISYGFARYETKEEAENCIRGLVSLKYEAGFARVCSFPVNVQVSLLTIECVRSRSMLV
jgi:hypothetical protein